MEPGIITTLHTNQDLCLDQFLQEMLGVTGLVKCLQGIPNLYLALYLHKTRKIEVQAPTARVPEKMARVVMRQASLRVQEGTPGAQPSLVLGPAVLADSFCVVATSLGFTSVWEVGYAAP